MRAALVGERGAAGMVAVLEEVARLIGAARAEIDAEHRFDVDFLAPVHELVGAELVGFLENQARSSRTGRSSFRSRRRLPSCSRT